MTKYWVVLEKFAGIEVEADSEKEAERIAYRADESEYEFGFQQNRWFVTNVEEIGED